MISYVLRFFVLKFAFFCLFSPTPVAASEGPSTDPSVSAFSPAELAQVRQICENLVDLALTMDEGEVESSGAFAAFWQLVDLIPVNNYAAHCEVLMLLRPALGKCLHLVEIVVRHPYFYTNFSSDLYEILLEKFHENSAHFPEEARIDHLISVSKHLKPVHGVAFLQTVSGRLLSLLEQEVAPGSDQFCDTASIFFAAIAFVFNKSDSSITEKNRCTEVLRSYDAVAENLHDLTFDDGGCVYDDFDLAKQSCSMVPALSGGVACPFGGDPDSESDGSDADDEYGEASLKRAKFN